VFFGFFTLTFSPQNQVVLKTTRNKGQEDVELLGEAGADEEDDENDMMARMQVCVCIQNLTITYILQS
jgi:hypothetical protein